MSPRLPALLLALLAVAAATSAVGGVVTAQTTTPQDRTPTNGTITPEETVIEVQLEADGDARWSVTEHFAITDEAERAAFDDLGASFEGRTAGSLGLETFRLAVDEANRATDRRMTIRTPDHVADRENASLSEVSAINGSYTLTFTWTNFAREEADRYVVEDAFNTSDGAWLGGLTADQRLIIALPPGHGASAAPLDTTFQDNELRWEGPTSFEPGYLRIVYSGSIDPQTPENGEPILIWAALGVAVVALLGAGLLLARRRGLDPAVVIGDRSEEESAVEDGEAAAAAAGEGEGDDEREDVELLSDEERVERLLDENGGRMKQANIVRETGWSNAKVSQLLSAMEEDERISKLRIGRENLITFPDEEVGDFET